jgi:hypothetical protein
MLLSSFLPIETGSALALLAIYVPTALSRNRERLVSSHSDQQHRENSSLHHGLYISIFQAISDPHSLFNSPLLSISPKTLSATLNASSPAGIPQYALKNRHKLVLSLIFLVSFLNLLLSFISTQYTNTEGKYRTYVACNKLSLISTSVAPFLTAPRTCVPNSVHLFSAVNITRLSSDLVFKSRPGRVQIVPHAASYPLLSDPELSDTINPPDELGKYGMGIRWRKRRKRKERARNTVANCCNGLKKSLVPPSNAFSTYSSPTTFFLISKPFS